MRRLRFGFYNLAPAGDADRGPFFVQRELAAIANNRPRRVFRRRPKVIGVCEAIHRHLPDLKGYRLIRDTSTLSRANVALYVREHLPVAEVTWIDHEETWPRVLHGGTHEPRSTLAVDVAGWTVVVGHAPQAPSRRASTVAARTEWLDISAGQLRHDGPVLLLSDSNGLWDELQQRVEGTAVGGTPIESAHARHAALKWIRGRPSVGGVPMLSDHKQCLLGMAVRA